MLFLAVLEVIDFLGLLTPAFPFLAVVLVLAILDFYYKKRFPKLL